MILFVKRLDVNLDWKDESRRIRHLNEHTFWPIAWTTYLPMFANALTGPLPSSVQINLNRHSPRLPLEPTTSTTSKT